MKKSFTKDIKIKKKSGEWFSLTEDDVEDLKLIKEIETNGENLEILRLLPEQKNNLLEFLQKYDVEKEGLPSTADININQPKLTGEIPTRSFRTYGNVLDEFADFCKEKKEQQKDLFSLALIEFVDKYR